MDRTFIRQDMMFGAGATDRLSSCHVAVFGIGGVGSYSAEALARAGIGRLTLVDNDTVDVSNINRQLCALHSTIGRSKTAVMADRVADINPACHVQAIDATYCEKDKARFFDESYDFIIDAIDTVSSKLSLIQTALERGIPIISAMGTGNKLDPSQFRICDISKTSGCHLARIMRKELRERGIRHHTVLFSEELPQTPHPLETPPPGRRAIPASVSWVPSCAGLMLAGHVIRKLLEPTE